MGIRPWLPLDGIEAGHVRPVREAGSHSSPNRHGFIAGTGDIRNRVFVEVGTASGREPTDHIRLQSYVGEFLQETGVSPGTEDEGPFEMRLLHFRRTFVEKMFAIHAKLRATT